MKIIYLFQTFISLLLNMQSYRKIDGMPTVLFILLTSLTMHAMDSDSFVITIVGAHEQVLKKQSKQSRFVQEKDELLKQADQNIEKGLWSFMAASLWLTKMFCMNGGLQPTMTDAYVLGCSCSIGCGFCVTACCSCAKAMMLKQE